MSDVKKRVLFVDDEPNFLESLKRLLREQSYTWDMTFCLSTDEALHEVSKAPFDAIVVTAGAPSTPPSLLAQLSPNGGRLVAPVGDRDLQYLEIVERRGAEYVTRRSIGCRFVPLLGAEGWTD